MTPRDRDGAFTHTHGVMPLLPTGVKKVHCGMAWFLRKPCFFYRCTKESNVDPAEVSKKGGFFYCPDEVIDHRDRGQIRLECGQIIQKVTDQRRSAIRTGPA